MTDFTINDLTPVAGPIALTTEIEVQRSGQAGTEKDTLQHVYDLLITTTFLAADNTFTGRELNSKASAASAPAYLISGTIFSGGSATTTQPHVLIAPSGSTLPTTYPTGGTVLGINTPSGFSGNWLTFSANGTIFFTVGSAGALTCGPLSATNINAGASNNIGWTGRGILTSPATGQVQLGAADAASPVNQTLKTQGSRSGTDTNVGGANATIASGNGTGTGTLSTLALQSPVAAASGTGAQTLTTGLTINNGTAQLTSYTVATLPTAAAGLAGCRAYVTDATAPTYLGALTGGGAVKCPVFCNGSAWVSC